ncbi:hypothetical protein HDU92_008805 [Lobulomyces angularis]|nr:hypothetical protein HDU92_008805 [Lobulomyces angularis]
MYGKGAAISGAAKLPGNPNDLIVSNIWENLENIEDYISKYLGRPRPAARFVEYCLEKILVKDELNFNEEFSAFYKDLTSFNSIDIRERGFGNFKNGCFFAYCFGFPYIMSAAEGKMLFERSFGILVENEDLARALEDKMEEKEYFKDELLTNLAIIIREPFILRTAFNYFSLKKTHFLKITSLVFNESLRGYLWEKQKFIEYFNGKGCLPFLPYANIENTPLVKKSKEFQAKMKSIGAGPDLCFFIKDDAETMVSALNTIVPKLFTILTEGLVKVN